MKSRVKNKLSPERMGPVHISTTYKITELICTKKKRKVLDALNSYYVKLIVVLVTY